MFKYKTFTNHNVNGTWVPQRRHTSTRSLCYINVTFVFVSKYYPIGNVYSRAIILILNDYLKIPCQFFFA